MAPRDPLADLAPKDAVPSFRAAAPLTSLGLGPEEGFVLSRVDGRTRLGELIHLVPFPLERTVEILRRLWIAGAIEIPGHTPPIMVERAAPAAAPPGPTSAAAIPIAQSLPPGVDITLAQA